MRTELISKYNVQQWKRIFLAEKMDFIPCSQTFVNPIEKTLFLIKDQHRHIWEMAPWLDSDTLIQVVSPTFISTVLWTSHALNFNAPVSEDLLRERNVSFPVLEPGVHTALECGSEKGAHCWRVASNLWNEWPLSPLKTYSDVITGVCYLISMSSVLQSVFCICSWKNGKEGRWKGYGGGRKETKRERSKREKKKDVKDGSLLQEHFMSM